MSYARTFYRSIRRQRTYRAKQLIRLCPVCGCNMRPVWYSRHASRCPECKTSVRVPWLTVKEG